MTRDLTRRELWIHLLLYPTHTLPTAAAPVIVATGLAAHTDAFEPTAAFLAFLSGWLIQLGGVLTDNYENLARNPADREHPELVWGVRSGLLTLQDLQKTILACFVLAVVAGSFLFWIAGVVVLVIGLLSIGASWIYSAGPFPLGAHGLGDPLFFVFFGPVSVVGSYVVQVAARFGAPGVTSWFPLTSVVDALLLSLPVAALTTSILVIDDIRDREFDIEKGKRTIAVRFGRQWSRVELIGFMGIAYVAPFFFWRVLEWGSPMLLPLLTLPLAISLCNNVLTIDLFAGLVPMTPRAARLLLAYSVLLASGVALS